MAFTEKTNKLINVLGGKANSHTMELASNGYKYGYEGKTPEYISGSITEKSLYQHAFQDGQGTKVKEDFKKRLADLEEKLEAMGGKQ